MRLHRLPVRARAARAMRAFAAAFAVMAVGAAQPARAQESLTLKRIAETGVISIGFRDGSIPLSYLDDKQRPIGYHMDICHRIVEAVKQRLKLRDLAVKLTPVTSATRMPMLVNHAVDLECGSTTNTVERQETVSFLMTTFVANGRMLSRRGSGIATIDDLRGRTVVSTAGTTNLRFLLDVNAARQLDMKIVVARDHVEAFRLVENERADAFVMDDVLLHSLAATARRPEAFSVSGEALTIEPYGIAVRRHDPEFKRLADEVIVGLFRSGEIHQLYRKWFQSPIPPRQINLQLPMSPLLAKVIARPTDSGDPSRYR